MTYQGTQEPGWVPPDIEGQSEDVPGQSSAAQGGRAATQGSSSTRSRSSGTGQVGSAAGEVATTAQDAARSVARETATEARAVAEEVSTQVRHIYATGKDELAGQAHAKTEQAAQGLRRLSYQMGALAEGRAEEAGPFVGYAREAQDRLTRLAGRLEDRGPQGVMDDVTRFARRRPLVFIGACAGAGFVLARFLRAGAGQSQTASQLPSSASQLPPSTWASTTGTQTTVGAPAGLPTESPVPIGDGDGHTGQVAP